MSMYPGDRKRDEKGKEGKRKEDRERKVRNIMRFTQGNLLEGPGQSQRITLFDGLWG